MDTIAIWSALPRGAGVTRPVAARDYWNKGAVRRYFAVRGLRAVLIDRARQDREADPLQPLLRSVAQGDSLIIFPEGTRGSGPLPGAFKSGFSI